MKENYHDRVRTWHDVILCVIMEANIEETQAQWPHKVYFDLVCKLSIVVFQNTLEWTHDRPVFLFQNIYLSLSMFTFRPVLPVTGQEKQNTEVKRRWRGNGAQKVKEAALDPNHTLITSSVCRTPSQMKLSWSYALYCPQRSSQCHYFKLIPKGQQTVIV